MFSAFFKFSFKSFENYPKFYRNYRETLLEVLNCYKLLFHSLFKVEFDIDHFVLGEQRDR